MKKINTIVTVLGLWAVLGVTHCTHTLQVQDQGGASGTEVSACTITGTVRDTLNNPIAGSLIRLRPFDYAAGGQEDPAVFKRDGRSKENGTFTFDSVPAGEYLIECLILTPDSLGQSLTCVIDSGEKIALLPDAVVRPLASLFGSVPWQKPSELGNRSARVLGTEHRAPIDSSGVFKMRVPAGWCRLNILGVDTQHQNIDTLLYLKPAQKVFFALPPSFSLFCSNLACDLAVVRDILDSNGLFSIMPESVVAIEDSHVVELHLRGLGIRVLPPSIFRLMRLYVLDIGCNGLREFPRVIEHLSWLSVLKADSNELWKVPASIGTMMSLRILDLSYNKLQSLPEPIMFLRLMILNLSGNMLCNIGEMTVKWLDVNSTGWRERQDCQ